MSLLALQTPAPVDVAVPGTLPNFVPSALCVSGNELLNRDRLALMDAVRQDSERRSRQLLEHARPYWEQELPTHRGAVHFFNPSSAEPTISVALVSMAARSDHLIRRLEEVALFQRALPRERFEAVIVLPDAENYDVPQRIRLEEAIGASRLPVTTVRSLRNHLGTNRNLATSEARVPENGLVLFLDDDVRLSPEMMGRMVDTWRTSPRLGILTVPSYTPASQMMKPNGSYSIAPIEPDLLALDRYGGMVGLTSSRLARLLPFCPSVDLGDDSILSMQLNNLGYVIGCVNASSSDWAVHEHSGSQASVGHRNFWKYLTYTAVTKFLDPDGFQQYDSKTVGHRMSVMMTGAPSAPWEAARIEFGEAGCAFLLREACAFESLRISRHPEISAHAERAIASLAASRQRLGEFAERQYRPLRLSPLDAAAYLGPFGS